MNTASETKKTVIIGANPTPERYAFKAAHALANKKVAFVNVGIKEGQVADQPILTDKPPIEDVHTVTLYIGADKQPDWYDYILGLKPHRIIFNPGAENPELYALAKTQGIEAMEACTLVLLATNQF